MAQMELEKNCIFDESRRRNTDPRSGEHRQTARPQQRSEKPKEHKRILYGRLGVITYG